MKITWLKSEKDKRFKTLKNIGMDVFEIKDLDKTDEKIDELIKNKYNPIIISNEVASFSEKICREYKNLKNVNIIIAPENKQQ